MNAEEEHFWGGLEHRVCAELEGMPDRALRRYWCDGFIPEEYCQTASPPRINGRVWFGTGARSQEDWAFTLLLPETVLPGERIAWDSLLPSPDVTEWLTVDLHSRHVLIELAAAVPRDTQPTPEQ